MQLIGLIGNYTYFCIFVDNYAQFVWVYCLKIKDEIRQVFKEFRAIQQNYTRLRILISFRDNKDVLIKQEFQA